MPAFLSVRLRLVFSAVLALVATFPAAADSRFITPPTYSVATLHNPGPEPAGMATADLNGDGKPDLVVANFAGQNIAVLLNNGDGTFKPPVFYTTPQLNTPYAVVIADFNGDGKLDIVSGGEGGAGGQVTVFLGNGDGTFQAGVVYFVGNNGSAWVAAADMNGDGILDLVVPGDSGTGNGDEVVSVLLGVGDGTFQAPITTTLTYGAGSYDTLAAADFNKDGKTDIALLANGRLLLLLGNGNGTFQSPVDLQVQSNHMVIAADMNNDGNLDLITVSDSGVYVLLGNGNGTFQTAVSNTVSGGPLAIALSDLNGDGKLDVVVGGDSPSALQVLFGNGTATLGSPILYATGSGPAFAGAIVTADFNGDGYPDVVASNAGDADVSVLFGSQSGSLQSTVVSQAIAGPMVPGDFNNDGKLDVLSLFPGLYDFFLFFGEGNGALQPPAAFTVGSTAYFVTAADFNGDGNLDVASANVKNVSVALGKGDGTFQPLVNYTSNLGDSTYIAAPDLKGDGKPDLAVITRPTGGSAVIAIMLNSGNGTFLPAVQYEVANIPQNMTFADFNGDGKLDMAAINLGSPYPISVFLGNGDGTFQPRIDESFGLACSQVIAADVNGDGKQDLVFACGYIAVALGNGDGTFQPPIFTLLGFAVQIVAGDFNGDGKIDILGGGDDVGVYYGNGDGTFSYTNYGLEAKNVALGNFNGDNAPDIVINNGVGLFILPNTGGTSDALVSTPNPSKVNQSVTFRASIGATVAGSSGTPTGNVTFRDGKVKLATVALRNGIARYVTSSLSQGTHKITASYSGDGNYNRNVSLPLYQKVQP